MTRLLKQSALHRKRGFHLGRAGPLALVPPVDPNPKVPNPAPVVSTQAVTTPATTAAAKTATTTDPGLIPAIISAILPSVASTTSTSSSTSTTPSTTPSVTTSPATTSSPSRVSSVPTITSATPHVVVKTTLGVFSSTSTQSQTPTQSAQTSGGMSAATVIGGIGGALAATLLLTVIIASLLRRWRKKRSAEDAFQASQFRRSAVLLNEKEDLIRPRPPSMIERRNAASPQPYSDESHSQYRALSPQAPPFAAGTQFGGNGGAPAMHYGTHPYTVDHGQGDPFAGYSGTGQGAPPIPGIHGPGAYAPYGVDPRYPQPQRYPHPLQYQNQQPQQQSQRAESPSSLAHPFSAVPVPKKLESTEGSVPKSLSTTSSTPSLPVSSNPGAASFVTHQPHEAPPAYANGEGYADVQRDVKVPPSTMPASMIVMNHVSDNAVPVTDSTKAVVTTTTTTTTPEPPRPHTVYNEDDVYGGM